jgi:hypothetical protein
MFLLWVLLGPAKGPLHWWSHKSRLFLDWYPVWYPVPRHSIGKCVTHPSTISLSNSTPIIDGRQSTTVSRSWSALQRTWWLLYVSLFKCWSQPISLMYWFAFFRYASRLAWDRSSYTELFPDWNWTGSSICTAWPFLPATKLMFSSHLDSGALGVTHLQAFNQSGGDQSPLLQMDWPAHSDDPPTAMLHPHHPTATSGNAFCKANNTWHMLFLA